MVSPARPPDAAAILSFLDATIAGLTGRPSEEVGPASLLVEDLGLTSIDSVEVAIAVEERYGTVIPDASMPELRTVDDLVAFVAADLRARDVHA